VSGRRGSNPKPLRVLRHQFVRRLERAMQALRRGKGIAKDLRPFAMERLTEERNWEKANK